MAARHPSPAASTGLRARSFGSSRRRGLSCLFWSRRRHGVLHPPLGRPRLPAAVAEDDEYEVEAILEVELHKELLADPLLNGLGGRDSGEVELDKGSEDPAIKYHH